MELKDLQEFINPDVVSITICILTFIYQSMLLKHKCFSTALSINFALVLSIMVLFIILYIPSSISMVFKKNQNAIFLIRYILLTIYCISFPIYVWKLNEKKCPQLIANNLKRFNNFMKYFFGGFMLLAAVYYGYGSLKITKLLYKHRIPSSGSYVRVPSTYT